MSKITFPRKSDIKPKHALFKFGMLTDHGRFVQIEGELPRHVLSEVERILWLPEPTYLLVITDGKGGAKPIFCLDRVTLENRFAQSINIDYAEGSLDDIDYIRKRVDDLIEERFADNGKTCAHLYLLKVE